MQTDESISDVVAGPRVVDQSSGRVQDRLESMRQVSPKADQIQQNIDQRISKCETSAACDWSTGSLQLLDTISVVPRND